VLGDYDPAQEIRHPACTFHADYVDIVESVWCPHCMLPSAVTFKQLIYHSATLKLTQSKSYFACGECGMRTVLFG
jgi:hypothetical protein